MYCHPYFNYHSIVLMLVILGNSWLEPQGMSRNLHRRVLDNMCVETRAKNFAATPTLVDYTHQFKVVTPISRCALLRIELTFTGHHGPR